MSWSSSSLLVRVLDEGCFEVRIVLRGKGLFHGYRFGKSSDKWDVGVIDGSHHNDWISGSLWVVACGRLMTAVRLTTRTFVARTVEHNMAVEMTELADVVVVLVTRVICRVEALFVFVPQRVS